AVELRFLEEGEQRPEIVLRLARESHKACRTDREVRDGAAQPGELLPQRAQALRPPHPLEHAVGRVLNRHVDVWHDARLARHQLDEALVNPCRVDVEQSEEHTSELQSRSDIVCRLLLEKKKTISLKTVNQMILALIFLG